MSPSSDEKKGSTAAEEYGRPICTTNEEAAFGFSSPEKEEPQSECNLDCKQFFATFCPFSIYEPTSDCAKGSRIAFFISPPCEFFDGATPGMSNMHEVQLQPSRPTRISREDHVHMPSQKIPAVSTLLLKSNQVISNGELPAENHQPFNNCNILWMDILEEEAQQDEKNYETAPDEQSAHGYDVPDSMNRLGMLKTFSRTLQAERRTCMRNLRKFSQEMVDLKHRPVMMESLQSTYFHRINELEIQISREKVRLEVKQSLHRILEAAVAQEHSFSQLCKIPNYCSAVGKSLLLSMTFGRKLYKFFLTRSMHAKSVSVLT